MAKKLSVLCLAVFVLLSACAPAQSLAQPVTPPDYDPTNGWRSASPEAQGMDSDLLAQMIAEISATDTAIHSVLVVRNGYLVSEAYFHPYTPETRVHIQSVTKSVIGLLVGKAIDDGYIESAESLMMAYFKHHLVANPSPDKDSIRLAHLLAMSSGLDCAEFSADGATMEQSSAWVQYMLDLPMASAPGKQFGYCNGNAHLLSAIVEQTTGMTAREYANQVLFAPLGIPEVSDVQWGSDPQHTTLAGYGLYLTPRDLAKLGLLVLNNGQWAGQQVVSAEWIAASATQHIQKEDGSGYGYLWTVYPDAGHYAALGLGGQQIHIYPAHNLVVVVTAALEAYVEAPEIEQMLSEYILPAVSSAARPENPQAYARLQAATDEAAYPLRPLAELPAVAAAVTERTYRMDENPFGWKEMQFHFAAGAETAQLILDGVQLDIGLDHIYRPATLPSGEVLLRGRWLNGNTFRVDYPYDLAGLASLAELGRSELQFKFAGDKLEIVARRLIFGGDPIIVTGAAEP